MMCLQEFMKIKKKYGELGIEAIAELIENKFGNGEELTEFEQELVIDLIHGLGKIMKE